MDLFDILQFALNVQSAPQITPDDYSLFQCDNCPASAFTAIGAAFSTLGYYAQAEWLYQIHSSGLGTWAILAYVIAGITLIISMAMGLPPRMYLWLAVGPAVFFWLTETRIPIQGVAWRAGIANGENAGVRDMREVWKLSEVGLANENYIIRNGFEVSAEAPPEAGAAIGECFEAACVSSFFAMVDQVVSDTIQQLVWMLGVSRGRAGNPGAPTNLFTDLGDEDVDKNIRMWDLTTNLKWEFVDSITSARVANGDIRQLFSIFMANECGQKFMEAIDQKQLTAATYSKGLDISGNVFLVNGLSGDNTLYEGGALFCDSTSFDNEYLGPEFELIPLLAQATVPTPNALRRIMTQSRTGLVGAESGIAQYTELLEARAESNPTQTMNIRDNINCRTFLAVLMQGLRWEAAQITYQLLRSAPYGMLPGAYAAQMLYGWDIKNGDFIDPKQISYEEAPRYLENLILVHLFRNELQIAPSQITERRMTSGQVAVKNIEDFQRINGQKAKYGELYTWALLMPYFQGKLLYFLAIAYPFAAILVVVPGMHRVILQWIQFWVWVKLWDLGFAMVTILERSVWAMTSNSFASGQVNSVVMDLAKINPTCFEPRPFDKTMVDTFLPTSMDIPVLHGDGLAYMVDSLLKLSTNVDLDMANTYYVYIMSALYFAIPAVTGQLVLGAKSGAAGMISSAIGQISSPAGSAAGQSAAADIGAKMKMNQATGRQEAFAMAMRNSGLASAALRSSNMQTQSSIAADTAQTKSGLYGNLQSANSMEKDSINSGANVQRAYATMGAAAGGAFFGGKQHDPDNKMGGNNKAGALAHWAAMGASFDIERRRNAANQALNKEALGYNKEQAKLAAEGFQNRAQSSISGLESGRAESHASFAGEQAAWDAANNYAQANSDFAAAIGLGAGYLDAGQKPTNIQGMARDGALGGDAQAASYASNERSMGESGSLYSLQSSVDGLAGAAGHRSDSASQVADQQYASKYAEDRVSQANDWIRKHENTDPTKE